MTALRLRELMEERVADVETGDLAAPAWARAGLVRRRRRIAAIGTATAAMLVVAGGVALLDQRTDSTTSPTGRPSSTPTSSASSKPDITPVGKIPRAELVGKFRGAPFWWAPSGELDNELPALQVPGLPGELSMADEEQVATPPARVDAVFGTAEQQYRLLSDGQLVSMDLSDRLGPVGDEGGNMFNPLGARSVSPDGTQVFFRQPGSVEVWDLPTNTWRSVPTADYELAEWTRDGELWLPGDGDTGRPDPWDRGDNQYSQVVVGSSGAAELDWMDGIGAPTNHGPGQFANPEFLVAGRVGDPDLLALSIGRNKLCCSPVGWFSHDFVLFGASSAGTYKVLAWRVGTGDVYRVSEYTNVPRRLVAASWAEDAFTSFAQ
jgi:hypothetical protein